MQFMRHYIAELVGTFTLVFVGTSVATLQGLLAQGPAGWLGTALAFGFTLMVLVWVIGPVSGCHVNPAVTIPMAISGRLKWSLVPGYIIGQLLGALLASVLLVALLRGVPGYALGSHGVGANGNPQHVSLASLFVLEVVLTMLFVMTIFTATRGDFTPGFAGTAIGGALFIAHLIGVPLGDSSLNPARSFGPALVQGGESLNLLWLYIVAPVVGGVLGMLLYGAIYWDEPFPLLRKLRRAETHAKTAA